MHKGLRRLLIILYEALFIWTLFLVLGMQNIKPVYTSQHFLVENAGLLLLGGCGVALVYWVNARFGRRVEAFLQKHWGPFLLITLAALLAWQLYACYGAFINCKFDVEVILKTVKCELNYTYGKINHTYFSRFPNNLLLVFIFKAVSRIAALFGITNWRYSIVAFQCVLSVLAMGLTYQVTYDFSKSHRVALLAYLTAVFFAALSPWFLVCYSDATGFVFPVLCIHLYQVAKKAENRVRKALLFGLLGCVALTGYKIKPQLLILPIAVLLVELCCLPGKSFKERLSRFLRMAAAGAVGAALSLAVCNWVFLPRLHIEINPEGRFGWQHFVMMGLNRQRDGYYLRSDVLFSASFATNQERDAANLREAMNRIKAYGPEKLLRLLCRKQLVNYGDGTFAWNKEEIDTNGRMFETSPAWAQNALSGLLRSLIDQEGVLYPLFLTSKQLAWITILFFQPFVFLYPRRNMQGRRDLAVLILAAAVIGLSLFELIFEPRARYLFCYAPVYVILFAWGARNTYAWGKKHITL